jgi:hypothetical protein
MATGSMPVPAPPKRASQASSVSIMSAATTATPSRLNRVSTVVPLMACQRTMPFWQR